MPERDFFSSSQRVVEELSTVFNQLDAGSVEDFINAVLAADKVLVVGVGRVRIALAAFVKRLNHLGIPAWLVGDVNEPPITDRDLLLIGSGSGESIFPKNIAICAKKYGATLAHLTSSPHSSIAEMSDVVVDFHCGSKSGSGIHSIQPMTTLFEQSLLLFGDMICLQLMRRKGLSVEQVSGQHANLE